MVESSAAMSTMWKQGRTAAVWVVSLLLWPLARLLALARIRFLTNSRALSRIGFLALGPDVYVKTGLLGWRPRYRGALLVSREVKVNACLLRYWRPYIRIIDHPILVRLLWLLERQP